MRRLLLCALLVGCTGSDDNAPQPPMGTGHSLKLNWTHPTLNTDGSPIGPIASFLVRCVPSGSEPRVMTVSGAASSAIVQRLPAGTVSCTVTTVTTEPSAPSSALLVSLP